MTIGSLGIVGGFAAAPAAQRAADTEKAQHDSGDQARVERAVERAEQAAGIGQTEEDAEAQERDADGRRLWERAQQPAEGGDETEAQSDPAATRPKDPSGQCGGQLDLLG
jgi:hypothetical protein